MALRLSMQGHRRDGKPFHVYILADGSAAAGDFDTGQPVGRMSAEEVQGLIASLEPDDAAGAILDILSKRHSFPISEKNREHFLPVLASWIRENG